jgi:hypothetical protein
MHVQNPEMRWRCTYTCNVFRVHVVATADLIYLCVNVRSMAGRWMTWDDSEQWKRSLKLYALLTAEGGKSSEVYKY